MYICVSNPYFLHKSCLFTSNRDAILYTIVFVCLLWVAYGKDLKDHHPVNTAVINTFVNTPHPFTNISTVDELWHWMETDMVDVLYWDKWYNGQNVAADIVDKVVMLGIFTLTIIYLFYFLKECIFRGRGKKWLAGSKF